MGLRATPANEVNFIPYINLLGGWSKIFPSPIHNLLQQFPYFSSLLMGPILFFLLTPNLRFWNAVRSPIVRALLAGRPPRPQPRAVAASTSHRLHVRVPDWAVTGRRCRTFPRPPPIHRAPGCPNAVMMIEEICNKHGPLQQP
jgi:hypothetical protein